MRLVQHRVHITVTTFISDTNKIQHSTCFWTKQKEETYYRPEHTKIRNKLGNLYVKHLNKFITIPPL